MIAETPPSVPACLQDARGQLRINEPMSKHTSWRTGGMADFFYYPSDKQDLVSLIKRLPGEMQVHWIGLGSNLLVRDGGVEGIVICTSKGLNKITIMPAGRMYVESGVSCSRVARTAVRNKLGGVEFLAGVPGSFGGALAMNAGAFGGETWQWVERVECVDRCGKRVLMERSGVRYGYRHVELPQDCWLLGATLKLQPVASAVDGKAAMRDLLRVRSRSQPVQSANAGSVFRNPDGSFAAELIEQAGLKGHVVGGARVSGLHANFIINDGGASSADIERLIDHIRDRVRESCGVDLQLEVHIMGREKCDVRAGC